MAANTNVVYVDQEPDWGNRFVYEALFGGESPQAIAVRQYMKAIGPLATGGDNELSDALDRMEVGSLNFYDTYSSSQKDLGSICVGLSIIWTYYS